MEERERLHKTVIAALSTLVFEAALGHPLELLKVSLQKGSVSAHTLDLALRQLHVVPMAVVQ